MDSVPATKELAVLTVGGVTCRGSAIGRRDDKYRDKYHGDNCDLPHFLSFVTFIATNGTESA
jgi:hypothetical protein